MRWQEEGGEKWYMRKLRVREKNEERTSIEYKAKWRLGDKRVKKVEEARG